MSRWGRRQRRYQEEKAVKSDCPCPYFFVKKMLTFGQQILKNCVKSVDFLSTIVYNNIRKNEGESAMPITPKEIIKILKKNGFTEISQKGSHVKLRNDKTGKTVIVPMHAKDIPTGTEQAIWKQAGLK